MIWVIVINAAVLVLLGIALLRGKLDNNIAGYGTLSEEKRQRYDIKRLRLVTASFSFTGAVLLFLFLFETAWAPNAFLAALLVLCGIYFVLVQTWVKKRD